MLIVPACSFFGLSIILIPFNQPHALVVEILKSTKADSLVAAAGSLPLEFVTEGYPSLKHLIWVVEKTSRHMDWTEVPEGLGGSIDVTVWHELVHDADLPSAALPDLSSALGDITTIWQTEPGRAGEIVTFTHGNLVAAIAGLTYSLPRSERLGPADLFLPADALTTTYTLALTLSALWTGASVALNSVAGPEVDLRLAAAVLSPTVVAASAGSAAKLHAEAKATAAAGGLLAPLAARAQRSALAAGNMPRRGGVLASLGAVGSTATVGGVPGALRLVLVASRAGCGDAEPPVGEADLCDLRAATGARVVYALTAAKVAGAVAQTHAFDYRVAEGARGAARGHSHFGAPVGSVEVKLVDAGEHRTTDACARGEVSYPSSIFESISDADEYRLSFRDRRCNAARHPSAFLAPFVTISHWHTYEETVTLCLDAVHILDCIPFSSGPLSCRFSYNCTGTLMEILQI
jgi:hypothetical protein